MLKSGLTDERLDLVEDAFLPGRNMLFIIAGMSLAFQHDAGAVAIGLLNESMHIFPDQTTAFLQSAEAFGLAGLGRHIQVMAPLMELSKQDVIALAKQKGIAGTYSCHAGDEKPCGRCISCREISVEEEE